MVHFLTKAGAIRWRETLGIQLSEKRWGGGYANDQKMMYSREKKYQLKIPGLETNGFVSRAQRQPRDCYPWRHLYSGLYLYHDSRSPRSQVRFWYFLLSSRPNSNSKAQARVQVPGLKSVTMQLQWSIPYEPERVHGWGPITSTLK